MQSHSDVQRVGFQYMNLGDIIQLIAKLMVENNEIIKDVIQSML